MNTQNCMEAAMFAASEGYSVAVYEAGECGEADRLEDNIEFRFAVQPWDTPKHSFVVQG